MKPRLRCAMVCAALSMMLANTARPLLAADDKPPHNVIIFVADGLRHGAPDTGFMPTMAGLRRAGVDFVNSHALFPTFTTANGSAIATGHYLGDTGCFAYAAFFGYPTLGPEGYDATTVTESDTIMPDLNEHFSGNFLGEESLLARARRAGFNTAAIGKHGPTLLQDVTRNNYGITADNVQTVVIDDLTGAGPPRSGDRGAVPLPTAISRRIANDEYFKATYFRGQAPAGDPRTASRGANATGGTRVANVQQQKYLMDTVTRAVLPAFIDQAGNRKPFVLIYWSRDPDGTQHGELDVADQMAPGINGPTVHAAFENVDNNLRQLVEYLKATPDANAPDRKLWETTNLFITSDHGFGTISRGAIDPQGTQCESFATRQRYRDVRAGLLPPGFVAIDLAHDLDLPLYDAGRTDGSATRPDAPRIQYRPLKLEGTQGDWAEHPSGGSGLIGGAGTYDRDGFSAALLTVGNGGSELIYAPAQRARTGKQPAEQGPAFMQKVVAALAAKPYISGVFVDTERYGPIPGALSLADINLRGAAKTPIPAVVISFRNFATDPANPEMTGVEISNTGSRQGQGMHGTFGRHDTFNCMIAVGPDFKPDFSDTDPVSNADIPITLSHLLGIDLTAEAHGTLTGRVLTEALAGGAAPRGAKALQKSSAPTSDGIATVLLYQVYTDEAGRQHPYFDAGGFPGWSVGLPK